MSAAPPARVQAYADTNGVPPPVNALAVIREGFDLVPRVSEDDPMSPALGDWMRQMSRVQDEVRALVEADEAYDAALSELKDLNRKIATDGWLEVQFDALRVAGERFVRARIARDRALGRTQGESR